MKRSEFQTGLTNAYLRRQNAFADVECEMVTDDLLMLYVVMPVTDGNIDGAAWQLAHAIDAVAYAIEDETGSPFLYFQLVFNAARSMIRSRPTQERKDSADLSTLPEFLGGSSDPSGA